MSACDSMTDLVERVLNVKIYRCGGSVLVKAIACVFNVSENLMYGSMSLAKSEMHVGDDILLLDGEV